VGDIQFCVLEEDKNRAICCTVLLLKEDSKMRGDIECYVPKQ